MGKWGYGLKSLKWISENGLVSRHLPDGVRYDYALALDVIPRIIGASFGVDNAMSKEEYLKIGLKWRENHILLGNPESSYLRSSPKTGKDYDLHILRVVDLAELLYNLQAAHGIDAVYRRLVTEPAKIEATVLELEGFRLLWLAQQKFKIVHSGAGQNLKYECEIDLPNGTNAYCEMKCKLETTEYSENTLKGVLNSARGQLPKNGCGIILLKIPQTWVDASYEVAASINHVIGSFLRNTSRIAEVVWYARNMYYTDDLVVPTLLHNEYLNENSPHVKSLDGGIFSKGFRTAGETRWLHLLGITKAKLQALLLAQGLE